MNDSEQGTPLLPGWRASRKIHRGQFLHSLMRPQRRLPVTVFWGMHEIVLQVQKCHSLKAFRISKSSRGFQVRGSVSLKGIILAGCFVRRDKLKTQKNVLKNWQVIRDLTALSGAQQEVHGEFCDHKVSVTLLATALAQVYVGFKVETITKQQTWDS